MTIWHPYMSSSSQSINITKGDGIFLFTEDGKKYIDAISSWWVNLHGHANKEISEAIASQAKKLEHVIFTSFSHEPAEQLTTSLAALLPAKLDTFFFSDNGSTTVEIALKMSYQYFKNNCTENRNIFLALQGGYHGDTIGAMSVSDKNSIYHSVFSDLCFKTLYIERPEFHDEVKDIEERENDSLKKLAELLSLHGKNICALIVEPLVQGAAGMRIYRKQFLEQVVALVRQYDILVIFDEVMTGFFRTGSLFAFLQSVIVPDFVCLSKGLTGGFLPLGLTITTSAIKKAFDSSKDKTKTFMHGHSYTANPIACAAACCSLQILLREETQTNIKHMIKAQEKNLKNLNHVHKKRQIGTIAAFDFDCQETAQKITKKLMYDRILTRPIGNVLYVILPYCVNTQQIDMIYNRLAFHCDSL